MSDHRRVCWNPKRLGVPTGRVASGLCWTVGKVLSVFSLPLTLRLATIITSFPVAATDRRRARWIPRRLGVPRGRVASGLCWTVGK
eukprot:113450-Pyramimonas_sp.AAC.1